MGGACLRGRRGRGHVENCGAKMERRQALYVFRAEKKQFDRRCQFVEAKRKCRERGSLGITFQRRFDARLRGVYLDLGA